MGSTFSGKGLACTSNSKAASCGGLLCSLPWSMVWLYSLFAMAFIFFLSPAMELAILGQVMMGTMYVLLQQGCNELVEWCSRSGDKLSCEAGGPEHSSYQSYVAMADAVFSAFCCLGSIIPYVIMEYLSAEWVCYVVAGLVITYTIAFTSVFVCRALSGKDGRPTDVTLSGKDDRPADIPAFDECSI